MARTCSLLLLATILAACSSTAPSEAVTETFDILDHPVECHGQTIQGCLVIKFPEDTGTRLLYDGIQGFAPEWGYHYQLEVDRYVVKDGPSDSPPVRRVLRRVISLNRVPTGTQFELVLTGGGPVHSVGINQYQWFNSPRFDCPGNSDCGALATALAAGKQVKFAFAYPATAQQPLTVLDWQICASDEVGTPCEP